jgi:asparaginyl-tRNA synthetase
MEHVYIKDLRKHIDREVELRGWVYHRRSSGKLHFLVIRDGGGLAQVIYFSGDVSPELFELSDRVPLESSVIVRGRVREDKRAPGGFELSGKYLEVVHGAEPYPIQPKEHGVDFLLQNRHLWLRAPRQVAILKIRDELIKAVREFLDREGFLLVDAPIFTPAACEGTTTLFQTDYFGEKAYLTQSGQLYMEAAAMALGKVYCLGPTFRAEKSKTRRHLTEFWMLEPEAAWYHLEDVIDLAENLIVFAVERVLEKRGEDLAVLERDLKKLEAIKKPFPRVTYDQAIELLAKKNVSVKWGDDFGADEDTALSAGFDRPLIIHRFPAASKAFYMAPDPVRPELALGVDIIAPEGFGEIVGGGEREWRYDQLLEKIERDKLSTEVFSWYLDLRRYGSAPHSGFGLGIERTLSWICGVHHVRETIPFPRLMERIYP